MSQTRTMKGKIENGKNLQCGTGEEKKETYNTA